MEINGKTTQAMVDTGATHSFIAPTEAKRLNLRLERDSSRMKAVNSQATPIQGSAKAVPIKVGTWRGKIDLLAVPLDEFKVIIGMDFLRQNKAVPMPFANAVGLLGDCPCFIPVSTGKEEGKMISALQLKKGLKKGEQTYLATLWVEPDDQDHSSTPTPVLQVLKEFEDVMPSELPKALPPRRPIDPKFSWCLEPSLLRGGPIE